MRTHLLLSAAIVAVLMNLKSACAGAYRPATTPTTERIRAALTSADAKERMLGLQMLNSQPADGSLPRFTEELTRLLDDHDRPLRAKASLRLFWTADETTDADLRARAVDVLADYALTSGPGYGDEALSAVASYKGPLEPVSERLCVIALTTAPEHAGTRTTIGNALQHTILSVDAITRLDTVLQDDRQRLRALEVVGLLGINATPLMSRVVEILDTSPDAAVVIEAHIALRKVDPAAVACRAVYADAADEAQVGQF